MQPLPVANEALRKEKHFPSMLKLMVLLGKGSEATAYIDDSESKLYSQMILYGTEKPLSGINKPKYK
ncbi:CLUMA_CG016920, isoform A [Clunio marinus]|uniref:CLUMA_CG016920, isoform A n=1 Tax=Clunio marinus TaxID=568069 RepID=A0A1J1IYT0_9DIPT|nr:CLUMA_CG016920, isoform A [Clunio marinus]